MAASFGANYNSRVDLHKVIFSLFCKVFVGNDDDSSIKTNQLDPPVLARIIRLTTLEWYGLGNLLAWEIYGCKLSFAVSWDMMCYTRPTLVADMCCMYSVRSAPTVSNKV